MGRSLVAIMFVWLSFLLHPLVGERNADEEAICQPFLTSPHTTPLKANLERNLTVDEDGEFACELVLQDNELPLQIRLTIHEGLSWLAIRHVHMDQPAHSKVLRHLTEMTKIMPTNHNFALRAARWAIDERVCDPRLAAIHYHSLFYGPANKSYFKDTTITDADKYVERTKFALALSQIGDIEAAREEYWIMLEQHPLDYAVGFLLLQAELLIMMRSEDSATNSGAADRLMAHPRTFKAMHALDKAFAAIGQYQTGTYNGFDPSKVLTTMLSDVMEENRQTLAELTAHEQQLGTKLGKFGKQFDETAKRLSEQLKVSLSKEKSSNHEKFDMNGWTPRVFTSLLNQEEFTEIAIRREPIIFRLGSREAIDEQLHWKTSIWNDLHYLVSVAGDEDVAVEMKTTAATTLKALREVFPYNSPSQIGVDYFEDLESIEGSRESSVHQFGFGGSTYRKVVNFKQFLLGSYAASEEEYARNPSLTKAPPQAEDRRFEFMYGMHARTYKDIFKNKAGYLNTQLDLGQGIFRPPLNKVNETIPMPAFLPKDAFMEGTTLWMGHARVAAHNTETNRNSRDKQSSNRGSSSRLHFDATDNAYVLVKGSKTVRLLPPSAAGHLHTVTPTFGMSPVGVSYQLRKMTVEVVLKYLNSPSNSSSNDSATLQQIRDRAAATAVAANKDKFELPEVLASPFHAKEDLGSEVAHFVMTLDPRTPDVLDPFAHGGGVSVELVEGDILFLPAGWWHQISSHEGQHIAINYWWRPPGWRGLFQLEQEQLGELLVKLKNDELQSNTAADTLSVHTEL